MVDKEKDAIIGTKIQATPTPAPELGIDVENTFISNIVNQTLSSNVDITKLEGFSTVSQTRNLIYQMIDTMARDPILASYLKTISADAVEPNDSGQIIWCESDDSKCGQYVTYLLNAMNVDKNAFSWMHSLTKYGDLYIRLYRQSDYENDDVFSEEEIKVKETLNEAVSAANAIDDNYTKLTEKEIAEIEGRTLNEDLNVIIHEKGDKYVNYVEAMPNPGEMFELTKFGKTMGYIRAPISAQAVNQDYTSFSYMQYKLKRKDVEIYSATDFVHACLEDSSNRTPEEVDIFLDSENDTRAQRLHTYKVKRGQSELSTVFKVWRELSLLENSALLNRITKSSVVKIVSIEVGDMPKEQIGAHLQALKSMLEQKTAIKAGESMQEYTNPGPIENIIYTPVRNGIGAITTSVIGGDFDPKQLTDISHFQDKLFGALGIPKAFFGITDDGAGFNGGQSLAILSSRYAKSVKRLQNIMCQAITDLINLMLLDRGLVKYINKFTIRMQAPVTQEELDRRSNKRDKVGVIGDIMGTIAEVQNPVIKLKILKTLLADSIADVEVVSLLQEQIDELEAAVEEGAQIEPVTPEEGAPRFSAPPAEIETGESPVEPIDELPEEPEAGGEESYLPSPEELGVDLTVNK